MGMRVYELLLDISAKYDLRGVIKPQYLRHDFLAREWGLSNDEASVLFVVVPSADHVAARALESLKIADKKRPEEERMLEVDEKGTIKIKGWEEFYAPKAPSTSRVRAHRSRAKPEEHDEDSQEVEEADGGGGYSPNLLVDLWNGEADASLARVKGLDGERKRLAIARTKERPIEEWRKLLHKINSIPGLLGKNDMGWRVSFDWFLQKQNINKVEEGKYDKWGKSQSALKTVKNGDDPYED